MVLVAVRFIRAVAVILRRVKRLRQEHSKAESRQERTLHVALTVDLRSYLALGVHRKTAVKVQERSAVHRRKAQLAIDHNNAVFLFRVAGIDFYRGFVVAGLLPFLAHKLVVVRRCTPHVPRHRAGHDVHIVLHHRRKHALGLREHITEAVARHRHGAAVLHRNNKALSKRFFLACPAGNDQLVKAERVSLLKEHAVVLLRAVLQKHRHVALRRNCIRQRNDTAFVRGNLDVVHHAAGHRIAVLLNFPGKRQKFFRVRKIAVIRQLNFPRFAVHKRRAHRANDVFIFE